MFGLGRSASLGCLLFLPQEFLEHPISLEFDAASCDRGLDGDIGRAERGCSVEEPCLLCISDMLAGAHCCLCR